MTKIYNVWFSQASHSNWVGRSPPNVAKYPRRNSLLTSFSTSRSKARPSGHININNIRESEYESFWTTPIDIIIMCSTGFCFIKCLAPQSPHHLPDPHLRYQGCQRSWRPATGMPVYGLTLNYHMHASILVCSGSHAWQVSLSSSKFGNSKDCSCLGFPVGILCYLSTPSPNPPLGTYITIKFLAAMPAGFLATACRFIHIFPYKILARLVLLHCKMSFEIYIIQKCPQEVWPFAHSVSQPPLKQPAWSRVPRGQV